ncbi:MAG: hypothetical protein ABFE08_13950 [Armatimonadia bacterium]
MRSVTKALLLISALAALVLTGCARGGEAGTTGPEVVIDLYARYAGPINDAFYYFMPIDTDGDFGQDGPVPVAAGPHWENGWGTGSFSHYVEYHQGQYNIYRTAFVPSLESTGGGIIAVSGNATGSTVGTSVLTVQAINYGAVTVSGTATIASVSNESLQAAGTLALATNAAGEVTAGSVVWTPATSGGRALNTAERAAVTALNAGGVALTASSLEPLGLNLTLGTPVPGSQTLTVAPTTATIRNVFTPGENVPGATTTTTGTLQANTANAGTNTALPGATVTVTDFVAGGAATVRLDISPAGILVGPPFDYTLPGGGNSLRVTIDLATLGSNIPDLSINFISTNELIFAPEITDPNDHTYDALGRLGNRYVTFRTTQFQTINNSSGLFEQEGANDSTLEGPTTPQQRNSVDLMDWSITIRRLR